MKPNPLNTMIIIITTTIIISTGSYFEGGERSVVFLCTHVFLSLRVEFGWDFEGINTRLS
jgi:hypothetical protein